MPGTPEEEKAAARIAERQKLKRAARALDAPGGPDGPDAGPAADPLPDPDGGDPLDGTGEHPRTGNTDRPDASEPT